MCNIGFERCVFMKKYNIKINEDFYAGDEFCDSELPTSETEPQSNRRRVAANKKNSKKRKSGKQHIIFLLIAALILYFVILPPRQTVFLIAGTDKGGTRTDTLMLGALNSGFKSELTLISIPRDTLVSVSDENYNYMQSQYPEPSRQDMKINEVYHFAGHDKGMKILIDEIENKFTVDIDYYAKVDFDALTYIIDSIGGVKFDVPRDMNYDDPIQDLSIHLDKGYQVLNGSQSEQLIRYRAGYARADLERVEVQQNFMKAFVAQALSPKNLVSHLPDYFKAYNEYIDTNANFFNLLRYLTCAFTLDFSEIETHTMPGATGSAYSRNGYLIDFDEFTSLYGKKYR